MSTSAVTLFKDGDDVIAVYRHRDGNPDVAGADLMSFLGLDQEASNGSRRADPPYLAARYVAYLADKFRQPGSDNPCDFISCGINPGYELPPLEIPRDRADWKFARWGEDYIYLVEETSVKVLNTTVTPPVWEDLTAVLARNE
jgi:hypothetical protein